MGKYFLNIFLCVLLLKTVLCVYTREELTTKPPFTKKIWRKIALQPSELNYQHQTAENFDNSEITIHHNYSKVQIQGQNLDPGQTVVITETKQTKTYTYPPENVDQESFGTNVEPVWTKPQRYEGQTNIEVGTNQKGTVDKLNWGQIDSNDQIRRPKGHYIVREQNGTNTEGQIVSSEVKIHDKLMRLEQSSQNYETFESGTKKPSHTVQFKPQQPTYKIEYRPKQSSYITNTKKYSNMAFENCPKNATGPMAYLWSCTQFLNCWKGRGIVQNCAPGTKFNPESLECDYAHKVNCISGPHDQKVKFEKYSVQKDEISTICGPNFSGLLPHPTDCTKFINCVFGQTYVQDCGPGTAFNSAIQACDHPYKVGCELEPKYNDYKLLDKDIRASINNQLGSGFEPGTPGDYNQFLDKNYDGSSVIRVYDQNYITQQKKLKRYGLNVGQNCGQNCRGSDQGSQQQIGQNCGSNNCLPTAQTGQNFGHIQGQNSQNVGQQQDWNIHGQPGQNCGPNNCIPPAQTGQNGGQQQGQNSQNCRTTNCRTTQQTGQNVGQQHGLNNQGQTSQNCGPNNCAPPAQIGQNCPPNNPNCYDQNNLRYGQNLRPQTHSRNVTSYWTSSNSGQPSTGQNYDHTHNQPDYNSRAHNVHYGQNYDHTSSDSGQNTGYSLHSRPNEPSRTNYGQHGQNYGSYTQTITSGQNYGYGQRNTTEQSGVAYSKTEVKCPQGHSGLLPHPYICEKYLNCANGATFVQNCGPGTVFNPNLKVCDWPYNVKCTTRTAEDKRETTGQHGQNSGSNYGQTTIRNTTGYGSSTGHNHGQNTGQYHGHTVVRNTTSYGQNSGQNYGQNTGQSTHTTSTNYGQNTGQHYRPSGHHTEPHYGQNTGTPYGQTTTTITQSTSHTGGQNVDQNSGWNYGQPTGHTTSTSDQSYGQHYGQNTGHTNHTHHTHTVGRNDQNYGQNTGQTHHTHTTGIRGQNYDQNTGQSHHTSHSHTGQTHHTHTTGTSGQNTGQSHHTHTTGSRGQNYDQNYGQNTGQNHHTSQTHTTDTRDQNYGHNYGQNTGHTHHTSQTHTTSTDGQNYGQNTGADQQYSGTNVHLNHTGQNTGYTQVIGHRRPHDYSGTQNLRNLTGLEHSRPIYYRNTTQINRDTPSIFVPTSPTTLNYTIKVQESSRKTGRHWPPPFPSTDTSADYYFEETTEPSPKNDKKIWKNTQNCEEGQFECSFDECIPRTWLCDGEEDCRNGADEKNCKMYLQKFTTITNSRLYKHEVEKWLNTDLETCANYCLNSKTFICKSFNFRKDENVCMLCDTNVKISGALASSNLYDYYEVSAFSVNCSEMYTCSNGKCINYTQICDGNDDCGNRQDEKNCSAQTIGYEIKLAGSQFKNEGRIEVKVFNEWGYICDDKFGLRTADVVCKELGYNEGALEIKSGSYFARDVKENETFYLMDDVQCIGNETSIRDCDFNGWGTHNCMPQEIVGVVCKTPQENCPIDHWKCDTTKECLPLQFVCDGVFDCEDHSDEGPQHCDAPIELRIVNGTTKNEGRVEIRYHGVWGTICDDDFNDLTAKVICSSLGYHGSAVAKKDASFGPGIGPIWLDQINCFGNETSVEDCTHWNWGEHNCEHSEDAGVVCSNLDTSEFEKRSKDDDIMNITPIKPNIDDTIFKNKCGFRGDDLFNDENDDTSEIHFRVVKGSLARKGDYPWQATIRVKGKHKSSHWCGAVVISNKYVLTAAHCLVGFSKGSYIVRAGDYDVNIPEASEVEAYIEDFFVHEKFRQGGHMNNDIALIRLKGGGLRLSKQVQPICLPDKNTKYKPGLNCTISGFGSTETGKSTSSHQLRAGWVTLQSDDTCKMPQVYGDSITAGMICAGSLDEGVDSCDGDSGGPLACLDKGLFTLYGITSWGQRCGHINKPGVYVKVSEYRDWIDRIIEENNY